MDGSIIIGTKVDDKGFDKDVARLETKLKNQEMDLEIKAGAKDKAQQELNELNAALNKIQNKIREINTEKLSIEGVNGFQSDAQLFNRHDELVMEQKELNAQAEIYNEKINKAHDNLAKTTTQYEKQRNAIILTKNQMEELNSKIDRANFSGLQNSINRIGSSMEGLIHKAVRWGIALFGVRTAYNFLSRAFNNAIAQNEGLSNSISWVWSYLGNLVTPIIQTIVQWVLKAIAVVNYFIYVLTGIDMAARTNEAAIAKQTKATNKQTKAANNQARATKKQARAQKEFNKELANFDEINKLTDEKNKGADLDDGMNVGGGAAGGVAGDIPNTLKLPELSEKTKKKIESIAEKLKEVWEKLKPIRDIIKNIVDFCLRHPDIVAYVLGGVALLKLIGSIIGVGSIASPLGLLGIAALLLMIDGIVFTNVINQLKALEEDLNTVSNINKGNADGWKQFGNEIEKTGIKAESFDKIMKVNTASLGNNVKSVSEHAGALGVLHLKYEEEKQAVEAAVESLKNEKDALWKAYNQTDKNANQTQEMIDYLSKYKGSLETVNKNLSTSETNTARYSDTIAKNNKEIKDVDLRLQYLKYTMEGGTKTFEQYKNEVERTNKKLEKTKENMNKLNGKKATVIVDADTSQAERKTKSWWKHLFNDGIALPINQLSKSLGLKFRIPKLAKGGIINIPSRGVPVGSAIAGERGQEGVIPLTDSQQMALLGEAIGKYITVNTTMNNYMNGRLISRELKTMQNEDDFLYNR